MQKEECCVTACLMQEWWRFSFRQSSRKGRGRSQSDAIGRLLLGLGCLPYMSILSAGKRAVGCSQSCHAMPCSRPSLRQKAVSIPVVSQPLQARPNLLVGRWTRRPAFQLLLLLSSSSSAPLSLCLLFFSTSLAAPLSQKFILSPHLTRLGRRQCPPLFLLSSKRTGTADSSLGVPCVHCMKSTQPCVAVCFFLSLPVDDTDLTVVVVVVMKQRQCAICTCFLFPCDSCNSLFFFLPFSSSPILVSTRCCFVSCQ